MGGSNLYLIPPHTIFRATEQKIYSLSAIVKYFDRLTNVDTFGLLIRLRAE